MPWLASYPETIAKYVATRMKIGEETELVRNDTSPGFDGPDAFEKANGSSLGYVLPHNGLSMPQKFMSVHPEYHDLNLFLNGLRSNVSSEVRGNFPPWLTVNNGQPVTHATTRGKTSKGTDGGSNRTSGTTTNDGKGRANNNGNNKRRHAQPGGGAQGGGRDDDDDDRNNGKKKRPSPPDDADASDSSSDDEDEKPKPTRKTRRKTNAPRTPSPKVTKTRGRSFKQPNQTPPSDYRTPSAPPISPLTNNTRSTPPQNAQTQPITQGQPPPQNSTTTGPRQPLTDLPLPPSRGAADLILVPTSSSSPSNPSSSPIPPPPRNPDIIDMGVPAPASDPIPNRNIRRPTTTTALARQGLRSGANTATTTMITRDGSPVRVVRPPPRPVVRRPRNANPRLITHGPQPPFRDRTAGMGPGVQVAVWDERLRRAVLGGAPGAPGGGPAAVAVMVAPNVNVAPLNSNRKLKRKPSRNRNRKQRVNPEDGAEELGRGKGMRGGGAVEEMGGVVREVVREVAVVREGVQEVVEVVQEEADAEEEDEEEEEVQRP
ncbi:MAG: hypothetical protein LQ349_003932 [Xanthoria aureola]|nr:MAG: hypothetical protein LQ349_003932 [Xanthoria aureola]